jgi:hypothetical protein
VFERINGFSAGWDEMAAITPIAAALFGRDLEQNLEVLWHQRNIVSAAAESYVDDDGTEVEFTKTIRAELWGVTGGGSKTEDKVSTAIDEAIGAIEATLLPILRAESARQSGQC